MSTDFTQSYDAYVPPAYRVAADDIERVKALQDEIRGLADEKQALILAHNYQLPEVQDVAHVVGDSLGLAIQAKDDERKLIVFCGVHFMAEAAKVMSPEKTVLLPSLAAGCSLADSISAESLEEWKERYPDHTVVTYVNSSAEVKALSDICCTSANAASVVRSVDNDKILFTPDRNLGSWVAKQVPEKEVVIYDGVCPTHDVVRGVSVQATIAGLKMFWPSPPKMSLPNPMPNAPPTNAIHIGNPGGNVSPKRSPVIIADPSFSADLGPKNCSTTNAPAQLASITSTALGPKK